MKNQYEIENIEETEFGPKAISEMATLAMDGQRNWRHRGHLAPPDGPRSKMKVHSIAALAVRAWASFLGYPPSESVKIGADAAPSVIFWALLYENDECDPLAVVGPRSAVGAFHQKFDDDHEIAMHIAKLKDGKPSTVIVWQDRAPPSLDNGVRHATDEDGPIVGRHINLVALGRSIAEAAHGPLFKITIRTPKTSNTAL